MEGALRQGTEGRPQHQLLLPMKSIIRVGTLIPLEADSAHLPALGQLSLRSVIEGERGCADSER